MSGASSAEGRPSWRDRLGDDRPRTRQPQVAAKADDDWSSWAAATPKADDDWGSWAAQAGVSTSASTAEAEWKPSGDPSPKTPVYSENPRKSQTEGAASGADGKNWPSHDSWSEAPSNDRRAQQREGSRAAASWSQSTDRDPIGESDPWEAAAAASQRPRTEERHMQQQKPSNDIRQHLKPSHDIRSKEQMEAVDARATSSSTPENSKLNDYGGRSRRPRSVPPKKDAPPASGVSSASTANTWREAASRQPHNGDGFQAKPWESEVEVAYGLRVRHKKKTWRKATVFIAGITGAPNNFWLDFLDDKTFGERPIDNWETEDGRPLRRAGDPVPIVAGMRVRNWKSGNLGRVARVPDESDPGHVLVCFDKGGEKLKDIELLTNELGVQLRRDRQLVPITPGMRIQLRVHESDQAHFATVVALESIKVRFDGAQADEALPAASFSAADGSDLAIGAQTVSLQDDKWVAWQ